MGIIPAPQSPFIHILTCLQLPSLTAFPNLPDPCYRRGPPCLEPVWGLSRPVTLVKRRARRGGRLSRWPETEWPVPSKLRAWGDSSARPSRPSRGRRCQIHPRALGLRGDRIGTNWAMAGIRLLPPHLPFLLQFLLHLIEPFPYPFVLFSHVTCTVQVTCGARIDTIPGSLGSPVSLRGGEGDLPPGEDEDPGG